MILPQPTLLERRAGTVGWASVTPRIEVKHGRAGWVLGRLTVQDRFSALPCENLVPGWQVVRWLSLATTLDKIVGTLCRNDRVK